MRLAHISDLHVTHGSDFNSGVFNKAVKALNSYHADLVFISGDLTFDGLLSEYQNAAEKISEIEGKKAIVPGNHDEKNLGYKLFPEFFGETDFIQLKGRITIVGLASSEPDKDDGRLGRNRHNLIREGIAKDRLTIVGFHHHLIPIPNSGREHNIIEDAGETLDIILRHNVPLVLMGHRHVMYGVKIHNSLLVNAGTFSSNRTRGHFGHTFNIIDVDEGLISVTLVNIDSGKTTKMIEFNCLNGECTNHEYEEYKDKSVL